MTYDPNYVPHHTSREYHWPIVLNRLTSIIENDCDAPWFVYIKTFWDAAENPLILLLTPNPADVLEEYFDPSDSRKGAKRPRKKKKRRRWHPIRKTLKRIPEPIRRYLPDGPKEVFDSDGYIAKRLPAQQYFQGRRISGTEHVFWTNFNRAERAAWYWLIVDAAAKTIYNWHSGIVRSDACAELYPCAIGLELSNSSSVNSIHPATQPPWHKLYQRGVDYAEGQTYYLDREYDIQLFWWWHHEFEYGLAPYPIRIELVVGNGAGIIEGQIYEHTIQYLDPADHVFHIEAKAVDQLTFAAFAYPYDPRSRYSSNITVLGR